MTTSEFSDKRTVVAELRSVVEKFVNERCWQQFHSPKNLSMALTIEAGELMEHFQWISMKESREVASDPKKKEAIGEELADIFCYTLAIANSMNLDLSSALQQKMVKNRQKYPKEEMRGRYGHDDPNPAQA